MERTSWAAASAMDEPPEGGPAVSGRRRWITDEQLAAIRRVAHFKDSAYCGLDLDRVLDGYVRDFVEPLLRLAGAPATVADVGAGYGWLALAFALSTQAHVIAIEYDLARLEAARHIASILGVEHRIEWVQASIANLPVAERSMDAVYCIEVIEHTGVYPGLVAQLCRISKDVLVITTPNKLFPVINHDTALPFCHWLPLRMRDTYATAFRRRHRQESNLFWTPARLLRSISGFQRVSRFMQFASYADYRALHQRAGGGVGHKCLDLYLALASRLGRHAMYVLPNLASTFRRVD